MKVKFTFNTPSNGHTAQLVLEVVSQKSPLVLPGSYWFDILPIDSYQINEAESTDDYKEAFKIEPLYNNDQLIVKASSGTNLLFMGVAQIVEQ